MKHESQRETPLYEGEERLRAYPLLLIHYFRCLPLQLVHPLQHQVDLLLCGGEPPLQTVQLFVQRLLGRSQSHPLNTWK